MAKKAREEVNADGWKDTYGDLVTLLLCFFVCPPAPPPKSFRPSPKRTTKRAQGDSNESLWTLKFYSCAYPGTGSARDKIGSRIGMVLGGASTRRVGVIHLLR